MEQKHLTDAEISALKSGIDPNDLGRDFDAEELELISTLQNLQRIKGPAQFSRVDPFNRNRRAPRGDRRTNAKGDRIGAIWRDPVVFKDDENKIVDLDATRFERARAYLIRRRLSANRASSFKKLAKADRILRGV